MGNISISVRRLEIDINRLRNLKKECEEASPFWYSKDGGGRSIDTLYNVDMDYQRIGSAMCTLIDNSIQFFENQKMSFVKADEAAAKQIGSK